MYIGEQLGDLSERKLTWAAQLGVEHVAVATPTIRGIEQEDRNAAGSLAVAVVLCRGKPLGDLALADADRA